MPSRRTAAALALLTTVALATPAVALTAARRHEPTAAPKPASLAPVVAGMTTAAGVRVDALLADRLASAAADQPLRVFVHAADVTTARASALAAGLRPAYELRSVGVVAADGLPAAVHALSGDPSVEYLQADAPIHFDLDHTHLATRGEEARHVFATVQRRSKISPKAPLRPAYAPEIDGRGVSVAIIDSGVDGSHPFFQRPDGSSKVRRNLRMTCEEIEVDASVEGTCAAAGIDSMFIDAPNNDSDTMATGGHGTHVAGIVGGLDVTLGDGRRLHGAAPGADLIALGVGRTLVLSGVVPALQWVIDHHADPCGDRSCPPIRVINNSWSSDHEYRPDDVVNKLQRELIAQGVVVVWAASNDGGDGTEKLTSGYGQEPTPGSIMVANYDDEDAGGRDGALDSSSSRGLQGAVDTYPDVAAPGAHVLSSCRAYLPVCSTGLEVVENGDYNSISGTSMAAPHIAGIVAQLLQVNPKLKPAEIEDILEDTAHKFTSGGPYEPDLADRNAGSTTSFDKGHGLVDVVAAVARILGVTAPAAAPACPATGPVLTDPAGDTAVFNGAGSADEPSLDVRSLTLTTTADSLVATIAVSGLDPTPPPTVGEGEYFDITFTHGGRDYYASAQRDSTGAESFDLGYFAPTRTSVADGLDGRFDPDADTVTVVIPRAATADAAAGITALTDGTRLTGVGVVSRRQVVVVVPDADDASATCGYTVGYGNGAPPATTTTPGSGSGPTSGSGSGSSSDATLTRGGAAFTFTGNPTTGVQEPTGAGGIVGVEDVTVDGDASVVKVVTVAEAGKLTVTLSADGPADFDLQVLDGKGQTVGESEGATSDELVEATVGAGTYRIIVRTRAALESAFTLTAALA